MGKNKHFFVLIKNYPGEEQPTQFVGGGQYMINGKKMLYSFCIETDLEEMPRPEDHYIPYKDNGFDSYDYLGIGEEVCPAYIPRTTDISFHIDR